MCDMKNDCPAYYLLTAWPSPWQQQGVVLHGWFSLSYQSLLARAYRWELFNSIVLLEIVTEYLRILMGWGGGSFIGESNVLALIFFAHFIELDNPTSSN
jgi:hypothetical protein